MTDDGSEFSWEEAIKNSAVVGLKPFEFWELTPVELENYVQGRIYYMEVENDRSITNAWLSAGLERQKRLPKLESLLTKREKPKQTNEQMLAMVKMLNEAFGGVVVEG